MGLQDGLISHWKFESTLLDEISNRHLSNNGVPHSYIEGPRGLAAQVNLFFVIQGDVILGPALNNGFSFLGWTKFSSQTYSSEQKYKGFFQLCYDPYAPHDQVALYIDLTTNDLCVHFNSRIYYVRGALGTILQYDTWTHVAFVAKRESTGFMPELYINSVKQTLVDHNNLPPVTVSLFQYFVGFNYAYLGRNVYTRYSDWYYGAFDDCKLYDETKTYNDILLDFKGNQLRPVFLYEKRSGIQKPIMLYDVEFPPIDDILVEEYIYQLKIKSTTMTDEWMYTSSHPFRVQLLTGSINVYNYNNTSEEVVGVGVRIYHRDSSSASWTQLQNYYNYEVTVFSLTDVTLDKATFKLLDTNENVALYKYKKLKPVMLLAKE